MKTILKKCLTTVDGKECVEFLVKDSNLTSQPCDFCDYREDYSSYEDVSCCVVHNCGELSGNYFVLLDLVSLIV